MKDQQEALDAVDVSGVVELRPVVEPTQCTGGGVTPGDVTQTTIPLDPTATTVPATTAPAAATPTTVPAGFRGVFPAQTVPAPEPVATRARDGSAHRSEPERRRAPADPRRLQRVCRRRAGHR